MTRRFFGMCGVLTSLALVSGSCVEDPLADLDGTPEALIVSHTAMQINQGADIIFSATVVDGRSTPLQIPVSITPCSANIAVTPATPEPVPPTHTRSVVRGVQPAATCFDVAGGGFSQNVPVVVLPTVFGGALSSTTPRGGDTITIASTTQLKFDTTLVGVTFGGTGAVTGIMLSRSRDLLRVIVPFSPPGAITIAGVDVTYVPGLRVTLPTPTVTQTGNEWAAASSWQTAPDITSLIPAAPGSSRMIVTGGAGNVAVCPEEPFASAGPCMMFKYTLAAPTTLNFLADWEGAAGDPDVDIYVCADTVVANLVNTCFVDGGSGATGVKPQTTGNDAYPAGTYWFVVEVYFGSLRNSYITITRP